ncbi:response regulator transcription factor [Paenibacillus alvei]|uniref:Response regulator transcription factor n=1 Tax=Paenibacillus alvei TaxID=44250 RepID=A0ABT4H6S8_PAEAL|nr:response regulator transcription factor [Paenibacillus alvei]EJW15460.1 response regulator receiver domain protein [Paenibacillus alvei DSM 29]MCY9544816.1 response regulator transcription factor [Paenibacillus alvei]MCY9706657.1 response regulator transcription factor [Paenibacillus alvei]MCY9736626.1 response regulator transcription factor [Paenibacillus alvei]MCY9757938.1 response regulator transcription factor [Paenibacillus alvei]
MPKSIKIVIIEDHPAMSAGIKLILEQDIAIQVLGIAKNGEDGMELIHQLSPTVVLLDLNLPDDSGLNLSRIIKEKYPSVHIIIYTGYDFTPFFNRLIDNGVSGIMNKSASSEEILQMIHSVMDGNTLLPLSIFRQIQLQRSGDVRHYWEVNLTENEKKILFMAVRKYTNIQIADQINVSESSVENYLKKIYCKLGVRSKAEAISKVVREDGILSFEKD